MTENRREMVDGLNRRISCAAIVHRLTFNGQIVETGTTSYRLTQARSARKAEPRH